MRLFSVLVMFVASMLSTPIFAQTDCCQCGPSACGPAPEGGNCSDCVMIPNATCNGEIGLCIALLEGAQPPTASAPVFQGSPLILLAAGLTVAALSLLGRRRQRD
jgi:hypothetical protein